jgi:hypothetical protein
MALAIFFRLDASSFFQTFLLCGHSPSAAQTAQGGQAAPSKGVASEKKIMRRPRQF